MKTVLANDFKSILVSVFVKNLIFPLNNKGGVGKTSVIADLTAALAQRFGVGVIDTDYQASLGKTLLGRKDLGWRELDFYEELGVQQVELMQGGTFRFSSPLESMVINVVPTQTKVAVFPSGSLYRDPAQKRRLEHILTEFGEVPFVAVDLPPIVDPHMILDHTIAPIVKQLDNKVRLFPLIIATPDHDVLVDALDQYRVIKQYFASLGVTEVHPFVVLNKIPVAGSRIDLDTSRKFAELGVLYLNEDRGGSALNHVNRHFDHDNTRFRSSGIPLCDVSDGRFTLFLQKKPRLSLFPYLRDCARDHKYKQQDDLSPTEALYARSLWGIAHFIAHHSGAKPRKNYTKQRTLFDKADVFNSAVRELRNVFVQLYSNGTIPDTTHINKDMGASSSDYGFGFPKGIVNKEALATAMIATEKELRTDSQRTVDSIVNTFTEDPYEDVEIYQPSGRLLSISYSADKQYFAISVIMPKELGGIEANTDPQTYLGYLEVFLRNLNKVL